MSVEVLERKFRAGSRLLDDPDPSASPEEALAHYFDAMPMLRSCTLDAPVEEGGYLVYPIQRPAATTKGADSKTEAEVDAALDDWARADDEIQDDLDWRSGLRVLRERCERPAGVAGLSPFDIPLA